MHAAHDALRIERDETKQQVEQLQVEVENSTVSVPSRLEFAFAPSGDTMLKI